ncbi:MAG: class I SAM-dependent methyltransferase, partial [Thermoplasmata archaeon]|nr:class I SAM-dependent methyltransferase [Thermoplasmata archaeon]
LLAVSYREYVGIDVDHGAVDWANRVVAPHAPGATFTVSSRLPSDESFDAVTCFEVVEHVTDPRRLLGDLRRAVVPDAPVFLSTPNGTLSDGRPGWYMSPYHLTEFSARQFEALVSSTFGATGEYLAQYRIDRLDCLPQAMRRQFARRTSTVQRPPDADRPGTTPATLKAAHEWFRRIPSPTSLWRRAPLARPLRDGLGYSHLLWAGTGHAKTRV